MGKGERSSPHTLLELKGLCRREVEGRDRVLANHEREGKRANGRKMGTSLEEGQGAENEGETGGKRGGRRTSPFPRQPHARIPQLQKAPCIASPL